ncbi:hypothetical protein ACS0TY_019711 [Phlomoides rotata]
MEKTESSDNSKHAVWDCGSSLYDSFELKSFERQLDSAISSRSMSMPHLSDHRRPPPPPMISKRPTMSSKIPRSLHRLIRSIFRPKNSNNPQFGGGFVQQNSRSAALSTIPEKPEFDGVSPEIRSLVTRTASDRFSVPSNSIGIHCA